MLFTSLKFVLFFAIVLLCYYLLPGRGQRVFLLLANYVFYMWWEPKFGLLLLGGTLVTYLAARMVYSKLLGKCKIWLTLGVAIMIGQLVLFKYADFFLSGLAYLVQWETSPSLGLLLPIGISFYSFSAAGYLFDVYRGKAAAETSFVDCALALSFFPSILSGPIPRMRELLPQFKKRHTPNWEWMRRGFLRFVWGAAKKLVAANTLLSLTESAFGNPESYTGGLLLVAVIAYSLYIYLDFAAYTDMAIGSAWMLGFELPENFNSPYCVRTVQDFWRRWHMSLTGWFREYLFIPLGGSRVARWRAYCNTLIVFAVSGLWHGAAMTFVVWGLLNGIYQMFGQLTTKLRQAMRRRLHISEHNPLLVAWQGFFVFALITSAWIFFRAGSIDQAVFMIKRILLILRDGLGTQNITELGLTAQGLIMLPIFLAPFIVEDILRACGRPAPRIEDKPWRYCMLIALLVLAISVFGVYGRGYSPSEFVYFQF